MAQPAKLSRDDKATREALEGDWKGILDLLKVRPKDALKGSKGKRLLYAAVKQGKISVFDTLVKFDIDYLVTDDNGYNILHTAASEGHGHLVKHLLEDFKDKINIDQLTSSGETAYQLAYKNEKKDVMEVLKQYGARYDEIDDLESLSVESDEEEFSNAAYRDWPEIVVHSNLDITCQKLQKEIKAMSKCFKGVFEQLSSVVQTLSESNMPDQNKLPIKSIQERLDKMEIELKRSTKRAHQGVENIADANKNLKQQFKNASEYNDYVYSNIFDFISKRVSIHKNGWKELSNGLLSDYPNGLKNDIQEKIFENNTSEENMARESLNRWRVYNFYCPDKMEMLKSKLKSIKITDGLIDEVQRILEEYKKQIPDSGEELISDAKLEQLGSFFGNDWDKIGIHLGLNNYELEDLERDNKTSSTRNFKMLVKWRNSQPFLKETVIARLVEAFKSAKRFDIIKLLEKKYSYD